MKSRRRGIQATTHPDIEDRPDHPLLSRRPSDPGLSGSRRRSSVFQKRQGGATLLLNREDGSRAPPWLKNISSVFVVCALGAVGWFVAFSVGIWKPTIEDPEEPTPDSLPQVLGYLSAVYFSLFFTYPTIFLY